MPQPVRVTPTDLSAKWQADSAALAGRLIDHAQALHAAAMNYEASERRNAGDVREIFHATRNRAEAAFAAADGIATLPRSVLGAATPPAMPEKQSSRPAGISTHTATK